MGFFSDILSKKGPRASKQQGADFATRRKERGAVLKKAVGGLLGAFKSIRSKYGAKLPKPPTKPDKFYSTSIAGLQVEKGSPEPSKRSPQFNQAGKLHADIEHRFKSGEYDVEMEEFLYFAAPWNNFVSSNVKSIQYLIEEQALLVRFKKYGYRYRYHGITVEVAYDFVTAVSKGKYCWDHLRSAGVGYEFVDSESGRTPQRLNIQSLKSHKRLLRYLRGQAKKPRFGKVKTRRTYAEIVKALQERSTKRRNGRTV